MTWREAISEIEFRPWDNIGLKLVALGLAALFWFQVTSGQAIPEIVPDVPVELVDVPAHLALAELYQDTVSVRVRGRPDLVRELGSGQLSPAIDMSDAHAGENIVRLTPELIDAPFGVEVVRIEPADIQVLLERRIERQVPIQPVVEGDPAEGYEVVEKSVSPGEVRISGPRTRVQAVDHVSSEAVNITGLDESVSRAVALRVGDPLVEIQEIRSVELTIRIREASVTEQLSEIPVEVVNSRYRVAVNPETIGAVLSAPPSVLERLSEATIRAVVDAEGLEPRREDYLLEPGIRFEPAELGDEIEVLALTPQRRVNVHIYSTPAS